MEALIFILIYSILDAYFNEKIINNKDFHYAQAILRLFVFASFMFLSIDFVIFLQILALYWIVFDFSLNLFRKLPFFYVGKTSFLDKHLGKWIYLFKMLFILFTFIL